MNWVETLAEYYRLSRTGETQHWLCRRWLPQGEARLAYLRELLNRPRRRGGEQGAGGWPASFYGINRTLSLPNATAATPGRSAAAPPPFY